MSGHNRSRVNQVQDRDTGLMVNVAGSSYLVVLPGSWSESRQVCRAGLFAQAWFHRNISAIRPHRGGNPPSRPPKIPSPGVRCRFSDHVPGSFGKREVVCSAAKRVSQCVPQASQAQQHGDRDKPRQKAVLDYGCATRVVTNPPKECHQDFQFPLPVRFAPSLPYLMPRARGAPDEGLIRSSPKALWLRS